MALSCSGMVGVILGRQSFEDGGDNFTEWQGIRFNGKSLEGEIGVLSQSCFLCQ